MSTLVTTESIPIGPLTGDNTPQVLPYAVEGVTAEPSLSRETTGWVVAVPPPASEENWFRKAIWEWMGRLSCTGFFTQRATINVHMSGTPVAGDVLRISFDGNNNDYVMTAAGAANLDVAAAEWAQQITLDPTFRNYMDAQGYIFGSMLVFYRRPGVDFPDAVTVSVVSGTTTVVATDIYGGSGDTLQVTSTPSGSAGLVLLHGGSATGATTKLQYYGDDWEGAIAAGKDTGTNMDPANMGAGAARFGLDNEAANYAIVAGTSNAAGAKCAVFGEGNDSSGHQWGLMAGEGNTLSSDYGAVVGTGNDVSADGAFAAGQSNTASGAQSFITGRQGSVTQRGERGLSAGEFSAKGDSQLSELVVRGQTSGIAGDITLDVDGANTGPTVALAHKGHYLMHVELSAAYVSGGGGAAGDDAYFIADVAFSVNGSGTVTLKGGSGQNLTAGEYTGTDLTTLTYLMTPTFSSGSGSSVAISFDTSPNGVNVKFACGTSVIYRATATLRITRTITP